jgi:integrase
MRRGAVRLANTKTHKTRAIPLTLRAREVLREARDASPDAQAHERVFAIREKPLRVAFREAARASGLPDLIPYHLRHAFACTMADKGIPVSVIRDLLGHANLATTNAYLRSLPDRASEAAIDALEQAHAVPPA